MSNLESQLITVLSNYCGERGESEGAVDTLLRIVRERDQLAHNLGMAIDMAVSYEVDVTAMDEEDAALWRSLINDYRVMRPKAQPAGAVQP